MRSTTFFLIALLELTLPRMSAQMYLVAGTPQLGSAFAADLVKVGDSGVDGTTEILSQKAGFRWIAVSYEDGTAVMLSGNLDNRVAVIDLQQARVIKQCVVPGLSTDPLEVALTGHWLARRPGGELSAELLFARRTGTALRSEGLSMNLEAKVSCDSSFRPVPPYDSLKHIVAQGMAGVGDLASSQGTGAKINEDGDLVYGSTGVNFGIRVPADLAKKLPKLAFARIDTNTNQMLVAGFVDDTTRIGPQFLLLRKSDQTWHVVPITSDDFGLRGFGRFVAGVENTQKIPEPPLTTEAERATRRTAESAGRSEWRTVATRTGPSMVESFGNASQIYPGRLRIYNIDTEKLFTITTNQGDSEILLIEDNTVYYRVSNRLYKAPITDSGIGAATLIATDEAIRDAHWAFIKH